MSLRPIFTGWMLALCLLVASALALSAHDGAEHGPPPKSPTSDLGVSSVTAACPGGPIIDGLLLNECVTRTFPVGGGNKSVKVWYTKVVSTTTRLDDGVTYNLEHWINSDAEANQVAAWFQDAWQRFYADSGHHLYDNGCGNTVNVRMEDGIGWGGIAYWGTPGNCWIGIDAPNVRGGGGQFTVYHEAQHYLQYSFDSGCYGYLKPNYPDDSEFVEGYADLGADSVNAAADAMGYGGQSYNPTTSMYAKSYGNIFNKYFIEQLGTIGAITDAWHRIDALYRHYMECDAQNTLYVLDSLIPTLGGGSEQEFFRDFFAANWAKDWADPTTQPELVYLDDDASPFGSLTTLTQDVNMAGGSQSWSDTTPDLWAARYYQVRPQAGCPFIQMEVDGDPGAQLGINFMAAKTTAPTKVLRSAKIGEDYIRTFAAAGAFNRLVAVVNSFNTNYSFDVNFTCVSPAITILEPRQVKFAMVGEPPSPISFLARWKVTDGASSVRGIPEASFAFDAAGGAITVVPGTFQEVGDEYWAILLPPVKPAGTTFVNFRINLGSISAQETNALLYVSPGNSDIALSFDASGSMSVVDTAGEDSRLTNAKKAGQVIVDLLRVGDRILVQDWSAQDNPAGCGLPPDGTGAGNCPLDVITRLPRTDASVANLAALIGNARTGINNISAREWTPVGGGINAAKDALLALPSNLNPKHIFLLSDGRENVKPLYADIKANVIASGVVVNTIGLGPEAPGNLLAQIAADTGGVYRPVATSATGSGLRAATSPDAAAALAAANAPEEMAAALAAPFLPGQLGLANVYDYLDTEAQNAARIIHLPFTGVAANSWQQANNIYIDKSVNQLRLVAAGKQPDDEFCTVSDGRRVEVLMPGMDPQKRWIPISPRSSFTPVDWDIRNNRFDDVLVVTNPQEGKWSFRVQYYPIACIPRQGEGEEAAQAAAEQTPDGTEAALAPDAQRIVDGSQALEAATGAPYAFFINVSVQSTIQLEGRLLGLTAGQGVAGDVVTLIGTLLDKNGTVPAQLMFATVEGPAGSTSLLLKDDGTQNDGSAGDGIYGALFGNTAMGGGYSVRILASLKDPANAANTLVREWNGGFWIDGPKLGPTGGQQCGGPSDTDNDCMPDDWERRCKLIIGQDDRKADPDRDGLSNYEELQHGTLPCRADTDNGGENDGSEVRNQRNPLDPKDDKVALLGKINVRALNGRIMIEWSRPFSYTRMLLYVSLDPNSPGRPTDLGQGDPKQPGNHLIEGLKNGQTYHLWLQGANGTALGDLSEPEAVMPKADPDMPSGAMLIENGSEVANAKRVTLYFSATDTPLPGAAQGSAAHITDRYSTLFNEVSGSVQMRVSNREDMAGAQWRAFTQKLPWTLACTNGALCRVYAQFRDAAQNESLIVNDTIWLDEQFGIFLPLITK